MMKRKLFFVFTGALVCLYSYAQTTPPVIFYNQGAVYAKGDVYIDGGLRAVTDTVGHTTSQITVETSKVALKGDFMNDVIQGNVFTNNDVVNTGTFEFSGPALQKIFYTDTTKAPQATKAANWINFPNLRVENSSHVRMNARLAAKTKNIDMNKGWLILESDTANTVLDGNASWVDSNNQTILAHLNVNGQVTYENGSAASLSDRGFIEVDFKVPMDKRDGSANNMGPKSLVGFGSPFKELRTDYFMFNTLLEPQNGYNDGNGFFLGAQTPHVNPADIMFAGKGYVLSIDIFGDDVNRYPKDISKYGNSINFQSRARDGYRFNRNDFATTSPNYYNTKPIDYSTETLNTDNVSVPMSKYGYYYLSNPYTTPLDISELLQEPSVNDPQNPTSPSDKTADDWGVIVGTLNNQSNMHLRNMVWILNPNSAAEVVEKNFNPLQSNFDVKYTYNYQVAMATGGTYTGGPVEGESVIAPLQMFLVWVSPNFARDNKTSLTIPKNQRVMQAVPFLRSDEQPVNKRRDDFIIEFRDVNTRTTDRLSVVLRTQDELGRGAYSNVERIVTEIDPTNPTPATVSKKDIPQEKLGSQIFTKDADGNLMTVQFFPLETTSYIPIYHVPSTQKQTMQIVGMRLQTKDKVETLILEDHLKKVERELLPDEVYETESNPTDPVDRFVLRLKSQTGIDEVSATSIYAYQRGDQITVSGLLKEDFGGRLELFDVNGKLLSIKTVADYSEVFNNRLKEGAYFIRLTSDRVQFVKLLVK